jgi:hypothetical protein
VEDEGKGGSLGGGGVVCGVLVHSKTRYKNMFSHLAPVVGVKYFPPKGTYVFMFLLFGQCACGHGLDGACTSIGIFALWSKSTSMGTVHYWYWHSMVPIPVMGRYITQNDTKFMPILGLYLLFWAQYKNW